MMFVCMYVCMVYVYIYVAHFPFPLATWCTSRMGAPSQSAKPEKLVTVMAEKPAVKAQRAKVEADQE